MNAGVYLVTCTANGRRYVGSSKDIKTRWREHRNDLSKKKHHNDHWQKTWNKYGADQFEWVVLEELERDDAILREREQHWIEVLHPELNVAGYAFPTRLGAINGEAHRKRISEGQRKRWAKLSEDERVEQSKQIQQGRDRWWAGLTEKERGDFQRHGRKPRPEPKYHRPRRLTPEQKEQRRLEWEAGREQRKIEASRKRSEAQKGRPKSEAQKAKLSAASLAQWADPEYRAKHQAAVQAKMQDPEVLKRLSESHKGKKLSKEHRRKIGESGRGKKRSEETKRRLSEARRKWWAERKKQE